VVFVALAACLAAVPHASADHHDANLPWSSLLPTLPTPNVPQPHAVPGCRRARIACIDRLLARLRDQYERLDAACDHRVLFARSYLRITEGLREDLARERPLLFRHKRWMIFVISEFSNSYFRAYRNYERGTGPVPQPWRITFDEAARGDAHAGQDVLLASNAHTQHDLPLAYAEMGLNTPRGASRKHDHDAVNEVNTRVFDELEDEFAARYDPSFALIDLKPSPLDELGTMELVKSWREGAWRSAERLVAARTPAERRQAEDMVRTTSTLWAEFIRGAKMPGWRSVRDAHCAATAPHR
jgi:Family of unknown function (DUF5995)